MVRAQMEFRQALVVFWGSQLGLEAPFHGVNDRFVPGMPSSIFCTLLKCGKTCQRKTELHEKPFPCIDLMQNPTVPTADGLAAFSKVGHSLRCLFIRHCHPGLQMSPPKEELHWQIPQVWDLEWQSSVLDCRGGQVQVGCCVSVPVSWASCLQDCVCEMCSLMFQPLNYLPT